MNHVEIQNSQHDVCRILSMALLSDNELNDHEVAAMIETRIQDKMGITPDQFRSALHQLCEEILLDDGDKAGVAVTDPDQAIEMMVLINRDASMSFDDISQLVDLIYDTDSTVIKATLLDDKRIDETLDRIDNPQLQLWICGMLLYLIKADNVIHENEKAFLNHVLKHWGITSDMFLDQLEKW